MAYEDPNSLRLFIAVCETGSIAKAAEREFVSPSALSKRISDLEGSLNTVLFARGQRGVRTTAAGDALLLHARNILQDLKRMHSEVSDYGRGIRGHVRVFAIVTSIVEFLPEQLAAFLNANPNVRISLEERITAEVIRAVESGSADIGICRELTSTSTDLTTVPYGADHLGVVVNADHPFANLASVRFQDTLEFEHVALSLHASGYSVLNRFANDLGRELNIRFSVASFDAALRVIRSGLAIGILPVEAIERFRDLYDLRIIPLAEPWATREFVLCTRSPELSSPAARLLHDHLLRHSHEKGEVEVGRTYRPSKSIV